MRDGRKVPSLESKKIVVVLNISPRCVTDKENVESCVRKWFALALPEPILMPSSPAQTVSVFASPEVKWVGPGRAGMVDDDTFIECHRRTYCSMFLLLLLLLLLPVIVHMVMFMSVDSDDVEVR